MWIDLEVNDWYHFHLLSSENTNYIFRGQRSSTWKLEPSLSREITTHNNNFKNNSALEIESNMIDEFLSSYHLYTSANTGNILNSTNSTLTKNLEILSIMQHYGSPTRMLDWTYSPAVAAFFALDGAIDDFCIYVLDIHEIERRNIIKYGQVYPSIKERIFIENNDEHQELFLFPYEPLQKNERIRHQQGLFLVPSVIDKTVDEILESYHENDVFNKLAAYRVIVKKEQIKEFWYFLKHFNITHETIYPGFEGFCKSLKHHALDLKNFKL